MSVPARCLTGLTQLPSLHGLPQLEFLAASFNKLHAVSASSLPPSLLALHLAHNSLVSLPAELPAALPALRSLDLSHNALSELPQTLGEMACLTWLALSHNQLRDLPASITTLQQLHTLHAGRLGERDA
jgi:Leucine-rich repeat (LRR) protein